MKKILLITRQPPYGGNTAREALELALASALFDQQVSLLFIDDGVFQLIPEQQAALVEQKNLASMLVSLPLYDLDNIYVSERSLLERGLEGAELITPAEQLNSDSISNLISEQDHIFHV